MTDMMIFINQEERILTCVSLWIAEAWDCRRSDVTLTPEYGIHVNSDKQRRLCYTVGISMKPDADILALSEKIKEMFPSAVAARVGGKADLILIEGVSAKDLVSRLVWG